jgi:hypothetical protein
MKLTSLQGIHTLSKCVYYIVARLRRLYKTGIGLTTGFIGSHTVTVYTLYNSQQLSLFSSSEDFGSNSTTNSYGIPCHHYPGNSTELCTILVTLKWGCPRNCPSYIARAQTTKKTPLKIPLSLHDVITGTDPKENIVSDPLLLHDVITVNPPFWVIPSLVQI